VRTITVARTVAMSVSAMVVGSTRLGPLAARTPGPGTQSAGSHSVWIPVVIVIIGVIVIGGAPHKKLGRE
jgi:hypothetical protein